MPHRTTRPAPHETASASPGCPYLAVVISAPALRLLAPVELLALLVLAEAAERHPVRPTRPVIDAEYEVSEVA